MEYRFFGTAAVLENMRKQSAVSLSSEFLVLIFHSFTRFPCTQYPFQYPQESIDSFFVCSDIDRCLEYLTQDSSDDLAVGVPRTHAMSTSLVSNHEIFCFDRSQNIANYSISLAVRNDSNLVSKINEIIANILKGGLNGKWTRENKIGFHRKENLNENLGTSWIPFRLENFMVAFYFIYFPGLFLAITTFCAELYITKKKRESRESTLWRILSEFFDGHRRGNILRRRRHRQIQLFDTIWNSFIDVFSSSNTKFMFVVRNLLIH